MSAVGCAESGITSSIAYNNLNKTEKLSVHDSLAERFCFLYAPKQFYMKRFLSFSLLTPSLLSFFKVLEDTIY